MQDFTKPNVTTSNLSTKQQKWLTKDRFWNFVFWFGMSFGFSVALILASIGSKQNTFSYWISFFFWATIIGVPLLVRHFSKTTFLKDKIFLNSEGDVIPEKNVPSLLLIVVSTVISVMILGAVLDKIKASDNLSFSLLCILLFGIPSLFFIYKNCPISILFNRKAWSCEKADNLDQNSKLFDDSFSSRASNRGSDDIIYNPAYSSLSSNIYHRHR